MGFPKNRTERWGKNSIFRLNEMFYY